MLRLDLYGHSDVYIDLTGTIIVLGTNNAIGNKKLTFNNNVSFRSYISKINNTLKSNAEDLNCYSDV